MSRQAGRDRMASQAGPADRWISRAAAGTVAALAGLAGAISYSHMRQLAYEHGQGGWHAHAFPLSVDGLELVASLVLLADRRHGRRSGWLPWIALVTGTAGSLAANIATAAPDLISRVIAGWPALALLIAVKLLTGMLTQPAASASRSPTSHDHPGRPRRLPARLGQRDRAAPSPTSGPALSRRTADRISRHPDTAPRPADALAPGIADLLPAARTARDELHQVGQPLTRDALAARLRETGHPLGNSRLTLLLQALRTETVTLGPSGKAA